ncbi:MAG TPA: alpha/beta hydrolase [Rhodopila sp.]|nr:alpha/beta hydrolase [Rhodopila sp.]
MASKQAAQLDTLYKNWLAALGANPEMPLDELRDMFEHWGDVTAEPGGVDYIETNAGGVPAMWAVPKGCQEDRVLLCSHGGGYVTGSMYTHRKVYGHLAKAVGCRALIVHYGRAPENVHPGPVNDMAKAYAWLLEQGIKPQHIALTGDSAGGALAVTTMLRAREQGLPLPAASMPLSPWLDMEASGGTFASNQERDVLVKREIIEGMAATFLGEKGNRKDPLANPLHAELRGLPPVYIQVGDYETLLDDSRSLAEALRRADVEVKLEEFPEMQHVFQFLAGVAPEADDAIRKMATWVRPKLGLA